MALLNSVKHVVESVGKNNKAVYTVVAIACANAFFKPLTSLTDKKEKPETKKYAATREFLTEVVAVPTYMTCSWVAEKFAKTLKDPEKAVKARSNLGFLGVCTAAVFVIPALCSVIIKPITDKIFHKNQKQNPAKLDIMSKTPVFNINDKTKNDFEGNPNRLYHPFNINSFTSRGGLRV